MSEQQPIGTGAESGGNADAAVSVMELAQTSEASTPRFRNEWEFTRYVIQLVKASDSGWEQPFHMPESWYDDAAKREEWIAGGLPDLLLRHQDADGRRRMFVAELKTDAPNSLVGSKQRKFLEYFAQHMPALVLRPRDMEYIKQILLYGPPDATGEVVEPSLGNAPPLSQELLRPQRTTDAIVRRLAEKMSSQDFPNGDLAGLRRMNPNSPDVAAYWRLMAEQRLLGNPHLEHKWGLIMHGIALMMPKAHDKEISVGKALFEGGDGQRGSAFYSDLRLNQLLRAQGEMLTTLLIRLFRMMKAANQPFDWGEMASFILDEGDDAEQARLKIARNYYRAEYRAKPTDTATG